MKYHSISWFGTAEKKGRICSVPHFMELYNLHVSEPFPHQSTHFPHLQGWNKCQHYKIHTQYVTKNLLALV